MWPVLPVLLPVLPHGGWAPTRPPCVVCLPACLPACLPGPATDYHDTMVAHNATSELHLIPLEQQRTYCVGTPGEFGLPANDRWSIYANTSYNLK